MDRCGLTARSFSTPDAEAAPATYKKAGNGSRSVVEWARGRRSWRRVTAVQVRPAGSGQADGMPEKKKAPTKRKGKPEWMDQGLWDLTGNLPKLQVRTYGHAAAHLRTCLHACTHVRMRTHAWNFVHYTSARAPTYAYMRACACARTHARTHACRSGQQRNGPAPLLQLLVIRRPVHGCKQARLAGRARALWRGMPCTCPMCPLHGKGAAC